MLTKLLHGLLLLSVCLSLISGARAGGTPRDTDATSVTHSDLGTDR